MVYALSYRRPSHTTSPRDSLSKEEKQRSIDESVKSGSFGMSHGIPDALSFDRIIAAGVCPPCTVRDFMNYLKYIEHAAENLQFYLWFRDYTKRFSELPEGQQKLAPEWTVEQSEIDSQSRPNKISPEMAALLKGTDFSDGPKISDAEKTNPFFTPSRTPSETSHNPNDNSYASSTLASTHKTQYSKQAEGAFEEAGLKWQPFTIQPFREEITRIIAIYTRDGAPRQLNLSARERSMLLHALENTTHPTAFRDVITTVEWSLRCQAHPNFIRWTICNGNRPRVLFARGLGIGGIVAGIIAGILITLSSAGRAWRVMSIVGFIIGVPTLIAAWKGMCVVLHGMHHRHLRPWELFSDDDSEASTAELKNESIETLESSNSFESEPWVARYQKRNIIRKIFDREVWIEEPALRQIQDTIFLQSVIGGFIASCILVGIFCAVPHGNFY